MSCPRGDAAPDQHTKLRLFSASGGYCQNPSCLRQLFVDTGSERIHVAEIAHVFAANDGGPRANGELTSAERGEFDNLILLCSSCHTTVDKAEVDYPDQVLATWKRNHEVRLTKAFGAVRLKSRDEVFGAIDPFMQENRIIFEEYGPGLSYREDPESEMAALWQQKVRRRIIPNNRRILTILDINRDHMMESELRTLELFRQHVNDLEARHLADVVVGGQRRFPTEMNNMMRP